jgi:hypothetical protein
MGSQLFSWYTGIMQTHSILIAEPKVDFDTLVKGCNEALNHSVTRGVDNTVKNLSEGERFISILNEMANPGSIVGLSPALLPHLFYSVLSVAGLFDMMNIWACCPNMAFTHTESKVRDLYIGVTSGTMDRWRDAVITGSNHPDTSTVVAFNEIHALFVQQGLGSTWSRYEQKRTNQGYKLIEFRH